MIRLRSLGECVIEVGERRIVPQQEVLFATLLVLILERGRWVSRSELAGLLYSSPASSLAKHSVRQILYKLKRLGVNLLLSQDAIYLAAADAFWDASPISIPDTDAFDSSAALSRGFLPGYTPRTVALQTFIDRARFTVDAELRRELASQLIKVRRLSQWNRVSTIATLLRDLDPLNEEAHLALAEALARTGSKEPAIRLLDTYLHEVNSTNSTLRLPASLLRRRISDTPAAEDVRRQSCDVPLIGRDEDIRQLGSRILEATTGRSTSTLIWGTQGIGKSRVLMELTRHAILEGAQHCSVKCKASNQDFPLAVVAELVEGIQALPGALGCAPSSLQRLRRLVTLPNDSTIPQWSPSTAPDWRLLASAFADLVEAVADECPLLLVLDDLHWIDQQSAHILQHVVRRVSEKPVAFLFTSRHRRPPPAFVEHSEGAPLAFPLCPLTLAESKRLVALLLGNHESDISDELVGLAAGNPLYLSELAAHCQRTGNSESLPDSIRSGIRNRILHLPASVQLVLVALCVLDRQCTQDRLETLLDMRGASLWKALAMLEHERFIEWADGRPVPAHEMIASTATSVISSDLRRMIHHRTATSLASDAQLSASSAVLWETSHHWKEAGNAGRAIESLCKCAENLSNLGLPLDAAELLEQARAMSPNPAHQRQLLEAQARALFIAGRYAKQLEVFAEVAALSERAGKVDVHTEAELQSFRARWRRNQDIDQLMVATHMCLQEETAAHDHRFAAARLALIFADNTYRQGWAKEIYTTAHRLLPKSSIEETERCELELLYHTNLGELDCGVQAAHVLLDSHASVLPNVRRVNALRYCSYTLHVAGEVSHAYALEEDAYSLAARLGFATIARFAADTLACRALQQDDIGKARDWLTRAAEWAARCDDTEGSDALQHVSARIALAEGNPEQARAAVAPDLMRISRDKIRRRQQGMLTYYARLHLAEDPESVSPAVWEQLEELHLVARGYGGQDGPTYALALGLIFCGQHLRARELVSDYLAYHRRERYAPPLALSALQCATKADIQHDVYLQRALLGFTT